MIWFLIVPYVVVSLIAWRLLAGHIAWKCLGEEPDTEDWVVGIVIGGFTVLLWPLVLLGWTVYVLWVKTPILVGAERSGKRAAEKKRLEKLEEEMLK